MEKVSKTPYVQSEMLIRRSVVVIFETFIDPEITKHFLFTKGSGRLEKGKTVTWEWEMYKVIKGFVEGLMGVEADARFDKISSLYRGKSEARSELKDLPVLNTLITLKHEGNKKSVMTNNEKKKILWQPRLSNDKGKVIVKAPIWVQAGKSVAVNRI